MFDEFHLGKKILCIIFLDFHGIKRVQFLGFGDFPPLLVENYTVPNRTCYESAHKMFNF